MLPVYGSKHYAKNEYLFNLSFFLPDILEKLLNKASYYEQDIAVETRNWVIEHDNTVACYAGIQMASFEQVIEVQKRDEAPFALTQ